MKMLLLLFFLLALPACQSGQKSPGETTAASSSAVAAVVYDLSQSITLQNDGPAQPEKHNIWVALISDQSPYQQLLSRDIQPSNYLLVSDEFGNEYAEFDLTDLEPGSSAQINIIYQVAVNELTFDLADCTGDLPDEFNQAELHIESNNPQIIALAEQLSAPSASGNNNICEQIETFYNYIGSNLIYSYNGQDWGAQAALGKMGADCTEYSSLLIAMSRASGVPARYVEGLLHRGETDSVEAQQEHAWVELYLPGTGWVPVDPTLGRSSLTREHHFARYTPDHIIVTNGRNPSTLRGASYWSHLYWPGDSTTITVQDADWTITPQ